MTKKEKMRNTAIIMLGLAMTFFWCSLGHPDFGLPFNRAATYAFYFFYMAVAAFLYMAPSLKRG